MSAKPLPRFTRMDGPIITVEEIGIDYRLRLRATFPNGVTWSDKQDISGVCPVPLSLRVRIARWLLWRRYKIFLRACTVPE